VTSARPRGRAISGRRKPCLTAATKSLVQRRHDGDRPRYRSRSLVADPETKRTAVRATSSAAGSCFPLSSGRRHEMASLALSAEFRRRSKSGISPSSTSALRRLHDPARHAPTDGRSEDRAVHPTARPPGGRDRLRLFRMSPATTPDGHIFALPATRCLHPDEPYQRLRVNRVATCRRGEVQSRSRDGVVDVRDRPASFSSPTIPSRGLVV